MFKRHCVLAIGSILAAAVSLHADDASTTIPGRSMPIQLTVPTGWTQEAPRGVAEIMAHNQADEDVVVVVAETRSDFEETLAEYAKGRIDAIVKKLDQPTVSDPESTSVNGHDAYRYEIHGIISADKVHIGYVVTVLQSNTYFVQILACSPESKFEADHDEMRDVADGFVERDQ